MNKVFVSPHFDDAVCSCGCLMTQFVKQSHRVFLVTVFANKHNNELSPFAQELHNEWSKNGLVNRELENKKACDILKVTSVNLKFDDAIYRKVGNQFLYPINNGDIFNKINVYDKLLPCEIAHEIMNNFGKYGYEYYFPIGKGKHVDHLLVKEAGLILIKYGYKVIFYEEFYYDDKPLIKKFNEFKYYCDIEEKIKAIMQYTSQLKMLFDGVDQHDVRMYFKKHFCENGNFFEKYYTLKKRVDQNNYIGINYDGKHDSCVAYFTNKIEFIGQEERFSRKKKDGRKPKKALEYLFNDFDVDLNDVEYVFPILSFKDSLKEWKSANMMDTYETIKNDMKNGLNFAYSLTDNPIFVRHHDAHAASAYFTSGFNGKVLICTIDGGNDFDPYSTNLYEGYNGKIKPILRLPDISIASDYLLVTAALGFKPLEGEGKVTGLAAFGHYNENLINQLKDILNDKNLIHKATRWVNVGSDDKAPTINITKYIGVFDNIIKNFSKEDIAFAIQYITEQRVKDLLAPYLKSYRKIACAGGLFANVKLNSFIKDMGFDEIFVHPAMGDEGLALGAVLYHKSQVQDFNPFEMNDVYFGQEIKYNNKDLERLLLKENLCYKFYKNNLEDKLAQLLKEFKIIALFQGRMEYGPRALGHRSILVNANDVNINKTLNKKLNRTEFMPFAPVVYDLQAKLLFKDLEGTQYTSKFMTITRKCTDLMKTIAPAAVHIDGTARPQIVDEKNNKFYYNLLKKYEEKTKMQSALINTSFNLHGEPIVSTPNEAIKSFKSAELDYLVIGKYLIWNKTKG